MEILSLRLHPETAALYARLMEESDAGTNGKKPTADQFINSLLEAIQNPRTKEVSQAADVIRIQQQQNEIQELNTRIQEQNNDLFNLQQAAGNSNPDDLARIQELEHELFSAKSELTILQEQAPAETDRPETDIIMQISEAELNQVDTLRHNYQERQGIAINRATALYLLIKGGKIK
jgi:TolA-binding protein